MPESEFVVVASGGFDGCVACGFPELHDVEVWRELDGKVMGGDAEVLSEGRHRVVMLPFKSEGKDVKVAVKRFGCQSGWKDRYDRRRGTKARRSFDAAKRLNERDVRTPAPLAYMNRWEDGRLVESYFLSVYGDGMTCFRDELFQIYEEGQDLHRLVELLSGVGAFVREMHDAGFCHRDLGNQNIFMRRSADGGWHDFQTLDLNRGRLRDSLRLDERARDFDRMILPGVPLWILLSEYWQKEPEPAFLKAVRKYRVRYQLRARSHRWRHPFRKPRKGKLYPEMGDIWLWDDRSAQAAIVMLPRERKKAYPRGRLWDVVRANARAGLGVWRIFREEQEQAWQRPVELSGRIGMSLEATGIDFGKQRELLERLGRIPVLVRFCHHEDASQWEQTADHVRDLHEAGHEVMLAILQDRRAVKDPEGWREFLGRVMELTDGLVTVVEVCHAVNRMKWGVHSAREQAVLLEPLNELQQRYPAVRFTGPACIDFEFHYVVAALDGVPEGVTLDALSHHLYVDRRGAPENFQGKFSLLEKCSLLRAIAKWSDRCGDEVIVSEVNWPVEGSGVWSPVDATYLPPWRTPHHLNVREDLQGAYMLRYYVIALCSGMVDRVFWWRLVSHGFGLVDERAEGGWHERSGYRMLEYFLKILGKATFLEKISDEDGVYLLKFQTGKEIWMMGWANGRTRTGPLPFRFEEARDALGEPLGAEVELADLPVYFSGVSKAKGAGA